MPTNLTESDAWPANIVVPNTGEPADQTAWSISAQPLANRTTHLRKGVPGIAGSYLWRVPLNPLPTSSTHTFDFVYERISGGGGFINLEQRVVGGGFNLHLPLPPIGRISAVTAHVISTSSHVALPDNMPSFDVAAAPLNWTNFTLIGSAIDPSATLAAFENYHTFGFTLGTPHTILTTSEYWLTFGGEGGTNAQNASLKITGIHVTIVP